MGAGRYDDLHGDEPEIDAEEIESREAYLDEHADDWKYQDDDF